MAYYTRGDKKMKATADTSAIIAEFEAERDKLDSAFAAVAASVTAATYGIKGAVDNYGDLPAAGTLDENTIYIVRNDAGAPSGNGLYRVESGAWVYLDALNVQNASEVEYDNSASGLTATDAQAAVDELDTRLDVAEPAIASNGAHATGDGSDHANVALNDTHRAGDGSDHANVALNDAHRAITDGSNPHNTPRVIAEHNYLVNASSRTLQLLVTDRAGTIKSFKARVATAAAAGESMTIDLQKNSTSVLTGVVTIDNSTGTGVVSGTLKSDGTENFVADDIFELVVVYTAGGTPTPMQDFCMSMWAEV